MVSSLLQLLVIVVSQGLLTADTCSGSFYVMEQSLLESADNRLNLLRGFYPPREAHPVLVKVNYTFGTMAQDSQMWFWSESEFYLIQPLEIFQFTSLLFSNMPYRQRDISLELDANCSSAPFEYLHILTTRVSIIAIAVVCVCVCVIETRVEPHITTTLGPEGV